MRSFVVVAVLAVPTYLGAAPMTISGQEIGLANCSDMRSRVCWKIAELALMDETSAVCAGERGLSEDSVSFHFSNLDM